MDRNIKNQFIAEAEKLRVSVSAHKHIALDFE